LKPAPFEYVRASSVDHAIESLRRFGDEAKPLAGGQSLVPMMALRLARPTALIDLGDLDELRYMENGVSFRIGGMTTHALVARDAVMRSRWPMISEAVGLIGHEAVRNRGTIAGSLAHADPAAEWPVLALTLDAEIDVVGATGARTIPADEFFISYFTTSLTEDELITEVRFPTSSPGVGSAFIELARRPGDFGVAGVASVIYLTEDRAQDARLGLMGVAETPIRVKEAEAMLRGQPLSTELVEAVTDVVKRSINPPQDVHATSEFRRNAAAVITARAIRTAWIRAGGTTEA
jgi:carbon-monoxide dehydrogenase medium subunit